MVDVNLSENLKENLPYISATIQDLNRMNKFLPERSIRIFQAEILINKNFSITSPFTGKAVSPNANYLAPNSGCIYWFQDKEPFCVISSSLRLGNPLQTLFVLDETVDLVGVNLTEKIFNIAKDFISSEFEPCTFIDEDKDPMLFLGNANFAHFMWNEFPALRSIIKTSNTAKVNIFCDPLGVALPFCIKSGVNWRLCSNFSAERGWHDASLVLPGSVFCDSESKKEIISLAGVPRIYQSARGKRAGIAFKFYATLRKKGRTLENQKEFMTELVSSFLETYPNSNFILDGFSLPVDFERSIYDPIRNVFEERVGREALLIREVMDEFSEKDKARLYDINGKSLLEAFEVISEIDFYVTHAGTMQHKAAWLYPVPGVMHSNSSGMTPSGLKWHGSQVEDTISPNGISSELIDDLEVKGMPNQNDRNRDYRITDVHKAVREVVQNFEYLLS